jgi:hypothetical protein
LGIPSLKKSPRGKWHAFWCSKKSLTEYFVTKNIPLLTESSVLKISLVTEDFALKKYPY